MFLFLAIIALLAYSLPSFQGNFLYKRTRLTIPKDYFQLFTFLSSQDTKSRILNLPQGGQGWTPYNWGYSGSGFLWYGIEQPILDRAFDVWSNFNENYYWGARSQSFSHRYEDFELLLENIRFHGYF